MLGVNAKTALFRATLLPIVLFFVLLFSGFLKGIALGLHQRSWVQVLWMRIMLLWRLGP